MSHPAVAMKAIVITADTRYQMCEKISVSFTGASSPGDSGISECSEMVSAAVRAPGVSRASMPVSPTIMCEEAGTIAVMSIPVTKSPSVHGALTASATKGCHSKAIDMSQREQVIQAFHDIWQERREHDHEDRACNKRAENRANYLEAAHKVRAGRFGLLQQKACRPPGKPIDASVHDGQENEKQEQKKCKLAGKGKRRTGENSDGDGEKRGTGERKRNRQRERQRKPAGHGTEHRAGIGTLALGTSWRW